MGPLNLAAGRDVIRRQFLGITPPVDSGGVPGAVPPARPDPSNPALNQAVSFAIQEINRQTDHHGTTSVSLPVVAQSGAGPYTVPLATMLPVGNLVNDIRRVSWVQGSVSTVLAATSYVDMDRLNYQYDNQYASTPQYYWIQSYTLFVSPSPMTGGELNIYAGTGILAPLNDQDFIDQLPFDYQEIVWRGAAVKWLESRAQDAEAQALLQSLSPLFYKVGIPQIGGWYGTQVTQEFPSFGLQTYRRGSGLRTAKR